MPTPAEPMPSWGALTEEERHALEGLLGAGFTIMKPEVADRLTALGLVERLLGTFALTRAGRDFVLRHLGWRAS